MNIFFSFKLLKSLTLHILFIPDEKIAAKNINAFIYQQCSLLSFKIHSRSQPLRPM